MLRRAARVSLLLLAPLLALLPAARAHACQCAQPRPELAPSLAGAAAVVQARVRSHAFVLEQGFRTELLVEAVHKGPAARLLVVTAPKTCAFGFREGERYLVFAFATGDGGYTTTYCTRTAALADAAADVAWLGRHARGHAVPRPHALEVFVDFTDDLATQALRSVAWLWPDAFAPLLEPAAAR